MTEVMVSDPRVDAEPEGWPEFRRRRRLHPVWAYDLMGTESWLAPNPVLLATVRHRDRIVAAMSVIVWQTVARSRYPAAPRGRSRLLRPHVAEIAQPWLSGYPGIVFADEIEPAERVEIVTRFERALVHHLGLGLAGAFYRQLGENDLAALSGRGRLVKQVDPVSVLHNTFADTERWLASLQGARRRGLRRQHRLVSNDPTLVVRGGPGRTDLDWVEVSALINRHRARFPQPRIDSRALVSAPYLQAYARRPDVHLLTYQDTAGRLLALNTIVDNGESPAQQHWAALPVDEGGRRHLYFDSYVRSVQFAVRNRRPELTAGRGLTDLKGELGFAKRNVYGVAVPRPLLGRLR